MIKLIVFGVTFTVLAVAAAAAVIPAVCSLELLPGPNGDFCGMNF